MRRVVCLLMMFLLAAVSHAGAPQAVGAKVIFDTDIGDDIDDAYALGLLLRSPEVQVVGVTTRLRIRIYGRGW